jgi:putative transposase
MRKEPFFINDYVHVYNRGNRRLEIVRDELDRAHFIRALYYLNTENVPHGPFQSLHRLGWFKKYHGLDRFAWPDSWQPRDPLVKILAYILRDNHYHLLLQEIKEGGISRFMQKIGNSMANRFNVRYEEVGRIFQGSYKAKRVDSDNYLRYLAVYIQVKNAIELLPHKESENLVDFKAAYEFAVQYPYGSLSDFLSRGKRKNALIDYDPHLSQAFKDKKAFYEFSRNTVPRISFEEKKCALTLLQV